MLFLGLLVLIFLWVFFVLFMLLGLFKFFVFLDGSLNRYMG